jgi:hypothetical protein
MSAERWSANIALALLAAGCASPPAPRAAPASPPPLSRGDVSAIARAVEGLRGLTAKSPIAIEQLDEKTFLSAVDRGHFGFQARRSERMQAALSFADPEGQLDDGLQRAMHSSIVGFYHGDSKKIYLKSREAASGIDRMMERLTVAHEVEHALQAQHFGSINVSTVLDEDSRLARLALIEGDADITAIAYLSWEQNTRPERPIASVLRLVRTLPTEQLLSEGDAPIAKLSPMDRERMVFPYLAGDAFAADLYRAGGFELLSKAFARPPETTEQVLHPARYLSGERAVVVHAPIPPAGYTALATGRMGELQTRALLLGCIGWGRASAAAEGWGGDAFTIVASAQRQRALSVTMGPQAAPNPSAQRALLWSTAWDTEADAADFETALLGSNACLPALSDDGAGSAVLTLVRRAGRNVALARGLPASDLSAAVDGLLTLPEAPPRPEPPLGNVQLRPVPPPPSRSPGVLQGPVYTSAWLGITGFLPPNYSARVGSGGLELSIQGPGGALGMLFVSDRIATPQSAGALFDDVAAAFVNKTHLELDVVETSSYRIPLGDVLLRRWNVRYTPAQIEVAILPICGGAGALAFLRRWANPYDKGIMDTWFTSFHALGPYAPVCSDLVP